MRKFYTCNICGNLVEMIYDSGNKPSCCGEEMHELIPGEKDASQEHHVPVYKLCDKKIDICVGANPHPMLKEHHICWIELETDQGIYHKDITSKEEAKVRFRLSADEKPLAIYTFCNLHGLWIRQIDT